MASGPAIVLDRTGGADQPLSLPSDLPGQNSNEAYDLTVTRKGVKIHSRSSAGIFHGIQTLRQMVEGSGPNAALPVVEIQDWPSLSFRGTMVDISHGPLPTEMEIERQLDFLARWKANHYYLYTEDSIELKGYPLRNPDGRLTQDCGALPVARKSSCAADASAGDCDYGWGVHQRTFSSPVVCNFSTVAGRDGAGARMVNPGRSCL